MAYPLLQYNLLLLLRRRVKRVEGLEHLPPEGAYLVAANHNSWLDPAVIGAILARKIRQKFYFIASTRKWRWLGLGAVPIDRRQPARVLDEALVLLHRGRVVGIFPEGKSNARPALLRGRTGVARLALRSRLPVVPIGVKGALGASAFFAMINFWLWWRSLTITIGEALTFPDAYGQEETRERLLLVTDRIMMAIAKLSGKTYSPRSEK